MWSRLRWPCVALLPALLLLWSGSADSAPAPFLGLLSLLGGTSSISNGSSILETLALSHIQHKINTLQVLGDLLAIAANITETGISSLG